MKNLEKSNQGKHRDLREKLKEGKLQKKRGYNTGEIVMAIAPISHARVSELNSSPFHVGRGMLVIQTVSV